MTSSQHSPPDGFTYYAFISYNHRDERAAKWLQRQLEHYRLPAVARHELGSDVRIRPVFRYAVSLPLGELRQQIKRELEASKFLLVVCSPNSAWPNVRGEHWVNDEVRHFIELGRADHIIPVIVDGEPNAGGDRECFPPALRGAEIAGANLSGGSRAQRRVDFLKIVAKLLGLQPDQLIRHTEAEEHRGRRLRRLKFLPLFLAAALGIWFAWDSSRTVVGRFADYVDSFGLPQGIFPLTKEETAGRAIHYRFEYQGFQRGPSPHADSADPCFWNLFGFRRRLVRVVQANSAGFPTSWNHTEYVDRPKIQAFAYDGDNRLRETRCGSPAADGLHLEKRVEFWNENGTVNGLVKFFSGESQLGLSYAADGAFSPVDRAAEARTGISQHAVTRNADGRVVQCLFLNNDGANEPDADGVFGFSYDRDDLGRTIAQWSLFREGPDFVRRANRHGVAGRRYEYAGSAMRKCEYVAPDGRPVTGPYGWMVCEYGFDAFDNTIVARFFDERGRPALSSNGIARQRADYDATGFITNMTTFGLDGRPALDKTGTCGYRADYDASGNVTNIIYLDVDGKPAHRVDGAAMIRMEYDDFGHVTKSLFFGTDGRPALNSLGAAGYVSKFDSKGNCVEATSIGLDGSPTLAKNGVATFRGEFDGKGNCLRETFWGTDGCPVLDNEGIAGRHSIFDARGNETRRTFFGIDGAPVTSKDGTAGWRAEYDDSGHQTLFVALDVDGHPTFDSHGVAGRRVEYDDSGREIGRTWLDPDGHPTLDQDGVAEIRKGYDEYGNMEKETYWSANGELLPSGIAELRMKYDKRGNVIRCSYFGSDGNPTLSLDDGNAGWTADYDPFGNPISIRGFGLDGQPCVGKAGYAEKCSEYDRCGRLVRERYLDLDGRPVPCGLGYEELRLTYDDRGNLVFRVTCNADGWPVRPLNQPFAAIRYTRDERGYSVEEVFLGPDGRPTPHELGTARTRFERDARGNIVRQLTFGVDGRPTPPMPRAWPEIRWEYDACGRKIAETCFDGDGHLCGSMHCEYDAWGNMVRMASLNTDGSPAAWLGCGYSELRMEYDVHGNCTEKDFFDADGNLVVAEGGYASVRCEYDALGRKTRESYFGADGLPIAIDADVATVCWAYDVRGNCTEKTFFGIDGRPAANRDGVGTVRSVFDERGNEIESTLLDPDRRPILAGAAIVVTATIPGYPAAGMDIQEGDVWCRLGDVDFLSDVKSLQAAQLACQAVQNDEKDVVMARKGTDGYEFRVFRFPPDVMGIRYEQRNLADFEALSAAWAVWQATNPPVVP